MAAMVDVVVGGVRRGDGAAMADWCVSVSVPCGVLWHKVVLCGDAWSSAVSRGALWRGVPWSPVVSRDNGDSTSHQLAIN